jgi:hypothetical protein
MTLSLSTCMWICVFNNLSDIELFKLVWNEVILKSLKFNAFARGGGGGFKVYGLCAI